MAQEVFDVSGAGDTVIASFTLAIAAGASPVEAAIFSNHAAGVVNPGDTVHVREKGGQIVFAKA
jgi:bifunctional ADP-heptose synthase (sugar kinase/adenylyltransferase)